MRGELYKSNTKRRIKIKMSLAIRSELGINSDVKNGDKFTVSLIISTLTTELCKALGALKFKRKPGRLSGRARSCGVGLR